MKISSLSAILHALNHAGVRYLIAGGVAVNIHGYQRLTRDLDLIIQLEKENILAAIRVLKELHYTPILPVSGEDFADPEIRNAWIETKNMKVFSFISQRHPDTVVDVFATEPFNFNQEYKQADVISFDRELTVRIVTIKTLIEMKKIAGRDRDKDDIQHLTWILQEEEKNGER